MKRKMILLLSIIMTLAFINCDLEKVNDNEGGDKTSEQQKYSIKGFVQKGPFSLGSSISIQELDNNFAPTGKVFNTSTTDDFGAFKISSDFGTKYVEITAKGYYFDEVKGELSASELTLRVIADLSLNENVNINILTTLEKERVIYLIQNENKTFTEAKKQAEKEILTIFKLPEDEILSIGDFADMDISKEGISNAILLAISSILQSNNTVAELSELISKIITDIKVDGKIDSTTRIAELTNNAQSLDLPSIRNNLNFRYDDLGLSSVIPKFEDYIDSDGDGLLNKDDFTSIFTSVTNADLSTDYTSNETTIILPESIETAQVTVTNGSIIKNGVDTGLQTETVVNNDKVAIRMTASKTLGTSIGSTVTISYSGYSVTGKYEITTRSDHYFSINLIPVTDADLSTDYTSNETTIILPESIETAQVSITNGSIIKNGIDTGLQTETVINNDKVAIRMTASKTLGTSIGSTVTISYSGYSVTGKYEITTRSDHYFSINLIPVTDADLSTDYTSNETTIILPESIETAQVSITNGSIIKNGIDTGLQTETVINNDKVAIRMTASKTLGTSIGSTVTILYSDYSVTGKYEITTRSDHYFSINLIPVTDADLSTDYTSNETTIILPESIETAQVSITKGSIIKNGIDTGLKTETVVNNDTIAVKLTSNIVWLTMVESNINIDYVGNTINKKYSVKTKQLNWGEVTNSAQWSSRKGHTSVVFDNKMWVIGGNIGDGIEKNDVWYSEDGIIWTEATNNAQWSSRYGHTSLVFDNKIWIIGGYIGDGIKKNDVWYSEDGITWTEATNSAQWSSRYYHTSVVFDNKMWVIGGIDKSDVWCSGDGITWTEATAKAGEFTRFSHTSVIFDNKMWLIGGALTDPNNNVWYSEDGITWIEATANAEWAARGYHTSLVFDNKIWVIGGHTVYDGQKNDVWYSEDGITWTEATNSAQWSLRSDHTSVVFGNKMWVIGGYTTTDDTKDDVWVTE